MNFEPWAKLFFKGEINMQVNKLQVEMVIELKNHNDLDEISNTRLDLQLLQSRSREEDMETKLESRFEPKLEANPPAVATVKPVVNVSSIKAKATMRPVRHF